MRRAVRILVATIIVAAAILGGGLIYFTTFSPDRARYPVRGIDVSRHQGVIDWRKVAAADVSFAIIKATEGGDHVDEEFLGNFLVARSLGIAVGAYHFFTFCRPGAEQAANFIRTVPKDRPQLPPVIDIEYEGNCSARPSPEALKPELDAYVAAVEAAFGDEVVLYITGGAYSAYAAILPDRAYWVRWIAWHPGHEDWVYWQYHDRGRVDGIEGDRSQRIAGWGAKPEGPAAIGEAFRPRRDAGTRGTPVIKGRLAAPLFPYFDQAACAGTKFSATPLIQ